MPDMNADELWEKWVKAVMAVREAVSELNDVQAEAHMAVLERCADASVIYKDALVDAIVPIEEAVGRYEGALEALWRPAAEAL